MLFRDDIELSRQGNQSRMERRELSRVPAGNTTSGSSKATDVEQRDIFGEAQDTAW